MSVLAILVWVVLAVWWQNRRESVPEPSWSEGAEAYVPEVEEGLGLAILIVLDNSGSMDASASGDAEPKFVVARRSIAQMLAATDSFAAENPGFAVKVGVLMFNDRATLLLPVQPYDAASVTRVLERIESPEGGTAIGTAMEEARAELYRSGVFRKHMLVITDGENTDGPDPGRVAEEIFRRSGRSVRLHFVAFDTDPEKFGFLEGVEGTLLAADNAQALRSGLEQLYRTGILAESVDFGEDSIR